MVDVVTELLKEGVLSEYADDFVLMSETIEGLSNKFFKWKEAFESKGLLVNLGKTKVIVSASITKYGLSKSKVHPCVVCILRVKANSVLFVHCGKWIHDRCAGVKRVTAKFSGNFVCRKCVWSIRKEEEEKLCD